MGISGISFGGTFPQGQKWAGSLQGGAALSTSLRGVATVQSGVKS